MSWAPPSRASSRLVLARHGETEHSVQRRFSGHNDLSLTSKGQAQAAALALAVSRFAPVSALVSSPLRRCVQTAELVAAELGIAFDQAGGWIEVDFGDWEARTFAEVQRDDPATMATWLTSADSAPSGGESIAAAAVRVHRARDELLAAHGGGTCVVLSHVTPIKLLLIDALEAPTSSLARFHLDIASICVIDYLADGLASVRLMNDTHHLDALAL